MKLTDNIHQLRIDFEIALSPERKIPRFVNVLLLFGEQITLIDSGVKGSEERIFEYIRQKNRDISSIDTLILSHSHPDHIGAAAKIKELTGCRILAHEAERAWIENLELQNTERTVPGFFHLADRPVNVDVTLGDGQVLSFGNDLTVKVIHSPGHSKGSLNLLSIEDGVLFTADSIPLKNEMPNYDDYTDLVKSLAAIRNNKEYRILLTSWTPPVTDGEAIDQLIGEGEEYLKKIDTAVKECYTGKDAPGTDACACTIGKLGLPPFMVNPIVDKAFRSHFHE